MRVSSANARELAGRRTFRLHGASAACVRVLARIGLGRVVVGRTTDALFQECLEHVIAASHWAAFLWRAFRALIRPSVAQGPNFSELGLSVLVMLFIED